jgi:hypothetical protein
MPCLVGLTPLASRQARRAGRQFRPVPWEQAGNASIVERAFAGLAIFFALAVVPAMSGISPATAAETQCPSEENSAACQADMDNRMAVYVRGRNAYDTARTSRDFSEALALSRQLAAQGDKNGERLLKMVYLQLGWGAHRDYVQAYGWLSEGIAGGADYLVRWRQLLAEKMTSEQLAEAKKMAGN